MNSILSVKRAKYLKFTRVVTALLLRRNFDAPRRSRSSFFNHLKLKQKGGGQWRSQFEVHSIPSLLKLSVFLRSRYSIAKSGLRFSSSLPHDRSGFSSLFGQILRFPPTRLSALLFGHLRFSISLTLPIPRCCLGTRPEAAPNSPSAPSRTVFKVLRKGIPSKTILFFQPS